MLLMEVMGYKSTKTVYSGQLAILTVRTVVNNLAGPQPQDI